MEQSTALVVQGSRHLNWLDRVVAFISPHTALKRQLARRALGIVASSRQFRGSDTHRLRSDWVFSSDLEATPDKWELDSLRDRARDLNRNDPVSAGATDTLTQNIVGRGLQPQSLIRGDRLGISEAQQKELRDRAEDAFSLWVPFADSCNRLSFDDLQFLAIRKVIEDGEILVNPTWSDDLWRPFGRILELVEAERLETPSDIKDKDNVIQGIRLGSRNEPVNYYIRKLKSKTYQTRSDEFSVVPARDSRGRPMLLHCYAQKRPGQVRGIPFFAPVLSYFKDLSDYLEAEIVAARVSACLSVFITKQDALSAAVSAKTATETGTGARIQSVEPGLVSYLEPGESINVVDPRRGGETFSAFVENLLRLICIAIGAPYEVVVKDFSKTNYSSARAALLEARRVFLYWRKWFSARFCQPIYELILEEAFLRGLFPVSDFYQNKAEYCRTQWVGGGWGWVDPTKEVQASKMAIDYGLSTLADEVAGQGRNWEEVLEQRARENARAAELGVAIPTKSAPT